MDGRTDGRIGEWNAEYYVPLLFCEKGGGDKNHTSKSFVPILFFYHMI